MNENVKRTLTTSGIFPDALLNEDSQKPLRREMKQGDISGCIKISEQYKKKKLVKKWIPTAFMKMKFS
jgi:hypothetical protein